MLFSLFFVIHVDVAVLTHASCIKFFMRTVPWFFGTTVLMIAIVAKTLCIMSFIIMATLNSLFSTF